MTRTFTSLATLRNLSGLFDTNNRLPFYLVKNGVQDYNNSAQLLGLNGLARNLTELGQKLVTSHRFVVFSLLRER